ncbi:uncharacterized protein LOC123195574 [Mangifera indica]|uniref:uncharacterized protein LOC123195574 n=1 Tax=Mangifera indica TaxID=29780 RepID=UPI001CFABAB5|nr:uncharacterized protein LOC123195574 [Mangifera indica]
MAAAPSSSPSSDSRNSATHPIQPEREVGEVATNSGVFDVFEKRPDSPPQHFQVLNSIDYIEKYQKYEADYNRRLMAKYFSKKNLYGGSIFEETMTINGETIKSSRWPCTRSFADPVQAFEDQSSCASSSIAENMNNVPNGRHG